MTIHIAVMRIVPLRRRRARVDGVDGVARVGIVGRDVRGCLRMSRTFEFVLRSRILPEGLDVFPCRLAPSS